MRWLMFKLDVSEWMFLLVLDHPGCPRQNPESCKIVVCVWLCVCDILVVHSKKPSSAISGGHTRYWQYIIYGIIYVTLFYFLINNTCKNLLKYLLHSRPPCIQCWCLQLDGHLIRPGKKLKVNPSIPNSRLFVGNIPKSKSKDDIMQEFSKVVGELHATYGRALIFSCGWFILMSDVGIWCKFAAHNFFSAWLF